MSEIISCTHKVTLDIAKRDVHMIQVIHGDTANILEVNLCENGKEIPLENATLATITYSNDTFDEMQISEDYRTASVRINANCLKQGLNFAQISIYSGDNGLITADMLTIDCNQKIGGENPSCPNADMPKLKELINQLIQQGMADGISPEQIADAVANYLAKNPIEETDPNVHEWAKAEEKPTYTAAEVGALSAETLKPAVDLALAQAKASGEFDGAAGKSAYEYAQDGGYTGTEEEFAAKMAAEMPTTLPNPNALTFTGAVTGSYNGSEPVTVEIPGGGTGGCYLTVETITIGEGPGKTVKVNLATLELTNGITHKNGTLNTGITSGYTAEIPYIDGMRISTGMNPPWIVNYPPFIVLDNGSYTVPEYTTGDLIHLPSAAPKEYTCVLSGYSTSAKVYVNLYAETASMAQIEATDKYWYSYEN